MSASPLSKVAKSGGFRALRGHWPSPRRACTVIAWPYVLICHSIISPAAHPSAQALDRPTATVSPLRTQTSPSRLPATSLRPRSVVSPQHSQQPPTTQMCPRTAIPSPSAASAITPPNVSAASLSGEAGGTPISGLSIPSPINTGYKPDDKKNEKVSGPSWASPEPGAGWLSGPSHTVAGGALDDRGFAVCSLKPFLCVHQASGRDKGQTRRQLIREEASKPQGSARANNPATVFV